jgi:energy-converting hydrogenase Eha subunit E
MRYTTTMLGYIGLVLLVIGYATLLTSRKSLIAPINALGSIILTVHAVMLGDIPFIIVNALVSIILIATWIKDSQVKKHG